VKGILGVSQTDGDSPIMRHAPSSHLFALSMTRVTDSA